MMQQVLAAKKVITEMSQADFALQPPPFLLIDVRSQDEWDHGAIPGAHHFPLSDLDTLSTLIDPQCAPLIIYCAAGNRSAIAAKILQDQGYSPVFSLAGGYHGWLTYNSDNRVSD